MSPANPLPTALQAVEAAALQAVTSQVAQLNQALKFDYLSYTWANWLGNWTAGRITDKTTAPVPPMAYVVGYFQDPTTGVGSLGPYGNTVIQWPYPMQGTAPVCAQPPVPPQAPPVTDNQPPVTGNQRVMNVPPNDFTPDGTERTDANGVVWIREDTVTPWGTMREYLNEAYLTAAQIASIKAGE